MRFRGINEKNKREPRCAFAAEECAKLEDPEKSQRERAVQVQVQVRGSQPEDTYL